jgi:hypothetical protein
VFSSRLETAYRAITNHDENDLLTFFARYRGSDKKILDWIVPRMQVARLSNSSVEHLLSVLPIRIDKLAILQDRRGANDYISFLLSLLGRIVIRAPSKRALETFEWASELLSSSGLAWRSYSACGEVLEGAIDAMEVEERQKAMNFALHMTTPGEAPGRSAERDWPEIFDSFSKEDAQRFTISPHSIVRIDSLIALVNDGAELDRGRALRRLHILYGVGKLSSDQCSALELAIWARCHEDGWPSDTQLHPWIFLGMPGSQHADALFVGNIVDAVANGQVSHELLVNLRAGLERTEVVVSPMTLVSCVKSCLAWQPTATDDKDPISRILSGDVGRDRATGREIGELLARSLLPRLNTEDLTEDIVQKLKSPEILPHIPSLAATAFQVARLWPSHRLQAFAQIRSAIASRDPIRVYPAFIAMMQFVKNTSVESDVPREVRDLLLHACEQRTQPGLSSTLDLLGDMVDQNQLQSDELDRLSTALPQVLKEYRYDQKNLEVPSMAELPSVRKGVHRLSRLLLSRYAGLEELKSELDEDPLPEVRFVN